MTNQELPQLEALDIKDGTRALVRCDFNVPVTDGQIDDDYRIRASLPTLRWLRDNGASLVICAHRGRPHGQPDGELSLQPVAHRLGELLDCGVALGPESVAGDDAAQVADTLDPGDVLLLENLRFDSGERDNDKDFVDRLLRFGECYVNDAFGACHRAHASIVGPPPRLPSALGRLLAREVRMLSALRDRAERPFVAVLGGAKVGDKIGVVEALLDRCDRVLLGGALAFTFLAAAGHDVGSAPVADDHLDDCATLLQRDNLELPDDVVVAERLASAARHRVSDADHIPDGWTGADVGPGTAERFADAIGNARTVFWNGPMGAFEHSAFAEGTHRVASAVAGTKALTVVGGGDTVSALRQWELSDAIDHVSTGGGAALELVADGDLPGLAALRKAQPRPRMCGTNSTHEETTT